MQKKIFVSQLHCRSLWAAGLCSTFYIASTIPQALDHLNTIAIYHSILKLNFHLSYPSFSHSPVITSYYVLLIFYYQAKTRSKWGTHVENHFWNQSCVASTIVGAVEKNEFCALFNIDRLNVKQLLNWTMSAKTVSSKKTAGVKRVEESTQLKLWS